MKRRIVCLLAALAMLLGMLSGCGAQGQSAESQAESATVQTVPPEESTQSVPEAPLAQEPETSAAETSAAEPAVEPFVLPIVEEPVTLTYWMREQPFMGIVDIPDSEMTYWKEMEARTGVHMDIQAAMFFTAQENFQLMVASGAWPDIIECVTEYYPGGGDAAIAQEVILPMDDLLEPYMPNYQQVLADNEMFDYAVRTRTSGEVYTAGFLLDRELQTTGMVIRQDWLDQVDLPVPETYEELHQVLTAFKNDLGYGGALWATPTMTDCWEYGYNVSLWNVSSQDRGVNVVDGQVVYAPTSDGARDYVTMMNQWYQEGLVWQDFVTGATTPDESLIKNNSVGIWMCAYGADQIDSFRDSSDDPGFAVSPMPVIRQDKNEPSHVRRAPSYMSGGASISRNCEQVEIAARWIDYNYTEDGYLLNNYGVEGEGLAYDEAGNPHISERYITDPNFATVQCMVLLSRYGGPAVADVGRENYFFDDRAKEVADTWVQNFDDAYSYPNVNILTYEESQELSVLYSDLSVVASEALLSFITGERPLSQWEDYVAQMESMDLERYVSMLQSAYDRYQETLDDLSGDKQEE